MSRENWPKDSREESSTTIWRNNSSLRESSLKSHLDLGNPAEPTASSWKARNSSSILKELTARRSDNRLNQNPQSYFNYNLLLTNGQHLPGQLPLLLKPAPGRLEDNHRHLAHKPKQPNRRPECSRNSNNKILKQNSRRTDPLDEKIDD